MDDIEHQRRRIVETYARLSLTGKPIVCRPSEAEKTGQATRKQGARTDGKVIYSDRAAARAAARELEKLCGYPLREYPCNRSRKGHFHLTTDKWAMRCDRRHRTDHR